MFHLLREGLPLFFDPFALVVTALGVVAGLVIGVLPGLGRKPVPILEDGLYHADAGGLLRRLSEVDDAIPSVMLVGHNPAIEDLARKLVDGGDKEAWARMMEKFPTGALAVLETDAAGWRDVKKAGARLTAFIRPRDLD